MKYYLAMITSYSTEKIGNQTSARGSRRFRMTAFAHIVLPRDMPYKQTDTTTSSRRNLISYYFFTRVHQERRPIQLRENVSINRRLERARGAIIRFRNARCTLHIARV